MRHEYLHPSKRGAAGKLLGHGQVHEPAPPRGAARIGTIRSPTMGGERRGKRVSKAPAGFATP